MKVLIADISWVIGCRRGLINAQRNSFLKDISNYNGLGVHDLYYRVFVGDGTPTKEDDSAVMKSFRDANPQTQGLNDRNQPLTFDYVPEPDEAVLNAPDDLAHLSYKAKAAWQWAIDHGYDCVFTCFCDTYVDIGRLMRSGFENHHFIGMTYDANRCPQGGAGYWMDRMCLNLLTKENPFFWADDGWAGWALQRHGVRLYNDVRYAQYHESYPTPQNGTTSSHISEHVISPATADEEMQRIYKGMIL